MRMTGSLSGENKEEEGGSEGEEEEIVKGLCPQAKFVLEKPLSSYPLGKEGKKELIKNARDALRDQMAFEGKSKAVGLHITALFEACAAFSVFVERTWLAQPPLLHVPLTENLLPYLRIMIRA